MKRNIWPADLNVKILKPLKSQIIEVFVFTYFSYHHSYCEYDFFSSLRKFLKNNKKMYDIKKCLTFINRNYKETVKMQFMKYVLKRKKKSTRRIIGFLARNWAPRKTTKMFNIQCNLNNLIIIFYSILFT